MRLTELLRETTLFADLPEDDLESLAAIMKKRTYGKGRILFVKNSPGSDLYLIASGKVRIFIHSDIGQEIAITSFGPGEYFGELSLLDGLPRSAGAQTQERTVLYILNRSDFLRLLESNSQMAIHLLEMISKRMRHTVSYAEGLAFYDVPGRVALLLLNFSRQNDGKKSSTDLTVRISQSELASHVAASREMVNRVLSFFRSQGLIQTKGQTIIINDIEGLKRQINR